MKNICFSLSKKIFSITIVMCSGIVLASYVLLYFLMPRFYKNFLFNQHLNMMNENVEQLEKANTLSEEIALLMDLWQDKAISIEILDEYEITLHEISFYSSRISIANNVTEEGDDEFKIATVSTPSQNFTFSFNYNVRGEIHTLKAQIPLQSLSDARHVLVAIYPFAALASIIFSIPLVLLLTHWIVEPIKKIRTNTAKMANIEPDISFPILANDEIGDLSKDISYLYEQLRGTIQQLEKEIQKVSLSENKKIEFLQTVSHEMKLPLTSANSLIEAILYDVPPYCDDSKKYLGECKKYLDKSILLAKENLRLSEEYREEASRFFLCDIIGEMISAYQVILKSKQISYVEKVDKRIAINTKKIIFEKIISNIISNAVNHTAINGKIKIVYHEGLLSVFNSSSLIKHSEIQTLFDPLIMQGNYEHSTGLGLFIVKKLLFQLDIKYDFIYNKNYGGMEFQLDLRKLEDTSSI